METTVGLDSRALVISSDGHAAAEMADFRPYLPSAWHDRFDEFLEIHREHGAHNWDLKTLGLRLDPEELEKWQVNVLDAGRVVGSYDPASRIDEMARQGLSGEVIFPDFGLPFEIAAGMLKVMAGYTRSDEEVRVANFAYNRWLVDFCSIAPERFAMMAVIGWDDVEYALKEIEWAKTAGFRGVILPFFSEKEPLFSPKFEPIWDALEALELHVNSHPSLSSTVRDQQALQQVPHPACAQALYTPTAWFFLHEILRHLIWGGVFERHPRLQAVFTEQGSAWVVPDLAGMDYSWEGSYMRRDIRDVVKMRPSEYFDRQCHLGSSMFSRAEIHGRHQIGVKKMGLGVDYPHHEGAWGAGPGTVDYFQATLGIESVPLDEARLLVGGNAAALWNFDVDALKSVSEAIGPRYRDLLATPRENLFPRGDVGKPMFTMS